MENLDLRVKSFKNLRGLFLVSMVVVICILVMMVVTTSLNSAGLLEANPKAQAIVVIDYILTIARGLCLIGVIVVVFLARKLNKLTKNALIVAGTSVVFLLVGIILSFTVSVPFLDQILLLIGLILYVVTIYLFINGLLDGKATKEPWMKPVYFSLGTIILGQILLFIAVTVKLGSGFNLSMVYISQTCLVFGFVILFICVKQLADRMSGLTFEPEEAK